MSEFKDVVNKLIEKTESGELSWRALDRSWTSHHDDFDFWIYPEPNLSLVIMKLVGQVMIDRKFVGSELVLLVDMLQSKFPKTKVSDVELLSSAFDCLDNFR